MFTSTVGEYLVSAGDGGTVIIWHRQSVEVKGTVVFGESDEDENNDEDGKRWTVKQMLRAADTEDIYDMDFSPEGRFLVVGLTDNSAQVWDLHTGKLLKALKDHRHFVQGVAWDPLGQFVITQSCDRYRHSNVDI